MPWPDLSAHELTAIRRWAEATPRITEIRLFGSRAKGRARVRFTAIQARFR